MIDEGRPGEFNNSEDASLTREIPLKTPGVNVRMHGYKFGDILASIESLKFDLPSGETVTIDYGEVRKKFPEGSDAKYIDTYLQAVNEMASRLAIFSTRMRDMRDDISQIFRRSANEALRAEIDSFMEDNTVFASDGFKKIAMMASLEGFTTLPDFTANVIDIDEYENRFRGLRAKYDAIMAKAELNKAVHNAYTQIASSRPTSPDELLLPLAKNVTPKPKK